MNSPLLRRTMSAVVALLLFLYIGYQIYSLHHTAVRTETVTQISSADTVQADGFVIRREQVIAQSTNGVIDYIIPDGGKVAKGGRVALLYASAEAAAAQQKLTDLDAEIAALEKLSAPGDTYAADPDQLNRQVSLGLIGLLEKLNDGNFSELSEDRKNFLYLAGERQILAGKTSDFSKKLGELKEQRTALAASGTQATGAVSSPAAGYFISRADGFESLFDYEKASSLTAEELKAKERVSASVPPNAVGKVCEDFGWYYAFPVSAEQAASFKVGETVSIRFPFASEELVPASVAAVNQAGKDASAAVVLRSERMNSALAAIRRETAQVRVSSYDGLRVSRRAVHFETLTQKVKDQNGKTVTVNKEVEGVYVLHGSEIRFRQIVPLFANESYVVCDPNPDPKTLMTDSTVQLSDEVVVEGTDLYNGKVIQ